MRANEGWVEWFEFLSEYVEDHGHALVPATHVTRDGHKLGEWVANQREGCRRGRLSTEQQQALESLPAWTWHPFETASWIEGFEHLRQYAEREGNALVPPGYVAEDGYRLGDWVVRQRRKYSAGGVSVQQRLAFDRVPGWTWYAGPSSAV